MNSKLHDKKCSMKQDTNFSYKHVLVSKNSALDWVRLLTVTYWNNKTFKCSLVIHNTHLLLYYHSILQLYCKCGWEVQFCGDWVFGPETLIHLRRCCTCKTQCCNILVDLMFLGQKMHFYTFVLVIANRDIICHQVS